MEKGVMIAIAVALLVGLACQAVFIEKDYTKSWLPAVILKGTASLIFAGLGIFGAIYTGESFLAVMVCTGLIFGAIGDIILNMRYFFPKKDSLMFICGALVFFMGHVFYMCAYLSRVSGILWGIIAGVVITILLDIYFSPKLDLAEGMKIGATIYVGFIVILSCIAVIGAIERRLTGDVIQMIGTILFTVSDIILIYYNFGKDKRRRWHTIILSTYYVGQVLIALRLFFPQ
ncbi:MAG: lysoplasmalogenase [Lachnospiraceae bacterium]|nr:lysoplasmalogenase [Lachnospiraceae bacterium]